MSPPAHPLRSFLDRFLDRRGIDVRIYWALLRAYVLMDLRNQQFARANAISPKEAVAPIFWVVGQHLLLGLIVSGVLFARVDAVFFAFVALAVSMAAMAFTMIVEFNEVVLDPEDLEVIGHRPIPLRTYSAVRATNLWGWMLVTTVSLNLFPAIVGLGLRDTDWRFLPAYVVAAVIGNLATAGLVILAHLTILARRPNPAVQEVLAWSNAALIAVLFYGGQLLLRDPQQQLQMFAYQPPPWLAWLPPMWLAEMTASFGPVSNGPAWWTLTAWTSATVIIWAVVGWRLSAAYALMQPGHAAWHRAVMAPLRIPGQLGGRLASLVASGPQQRATLWLALTMLQRDHNLRMRCWPALSLPVAALAAGWFSGQLGNPFVRADSGCVLTLAAVYLLASPLPVIHHNFRFSRDDHASWLLQTAPIDSPFHLAEGLRKAVEWRLLLPVAVLAFVAMWAAWGAPLQAAALVLAAWLTVVGVGHASQVGAMPRIPFSKSLARGESLGPIAPFAAAVSAAVMLLAGGHFAAAHFGGAAGAYGWLAALAVGAALARGYARHKLQGAARSLAS